MTQPQRTQVETEIDNQLTELISMRIMLDQLAMTENDGTAGVFGGLSFCLQRIIDDVQGTSLKMQELTKRGLIRAA